MGENLIVKSALKTAAKNSEGKPCNVSGELADALNEVVAGLIRKACDRATDNGRSTVMPKDL